MKRSLIILLVLINLLPNCYYAGTVKFTPFLKRELKIHSLENFIEDDFDDEDDSLPIHDAILAGDVAETLRLIRESNIPDFYDEDENGAYPVHLAVQKGLVDVVHALIDRDHNLLDEKAPQEEKSPLHFAIEHNQVDVARLLLNRGADLSAKDEDGTTPLDYAVIYDSPDIVRMIISHPLFTHHDLNKQDNLGYTALHYAAELGRRNIVSILRTKRPNVTIANNLEKTARQLAMETGHIETADLIPRPEPADGRKRKMVEVSSSKKRR